MKKWLSALAAGIVCCICVLCGTFPVYASSTQASSGTDNVVQVGDEPLEITVPDGFFALPPSANVDSNILEQIGLTTEEWFDKVKDMQDAEQDLILYPEGGAYFITISAHASIDASNYFDIRTLSDAEFQTLIDNIAAPQPLADGSIPETHAERYDSPTLPFVHLIAKGTVSSLPIEDECYFTIMNGMGYTVETYQNNEIPDDQAAAVREIADSMHFTQITPKPTPEEQARSERAMMLLLVIPIFIIIAIVVAVVVVSKVRQRRRKRRQALVLDRLLEYRQKLQETEKKALESGQPMPEPETLIENSTKCTTKVLKKFGWMDLVLHHRFNFILILVISILLLAAAIWSGAVARVAVVCVLCLAGAALCLIPMLRLPTKTFQSENSFFRKAKTRRRHYQFREEDFRVTGDVSAVYPYVQIVEVHETKDYFYLYLSEKHVYILAKKSFKKGTPEDLRKLLNEKCIHF